MMNIQEVRQKFPQYNDLSDQQLLEGLHAKYYSDMPKDQFFAKFQSEQVTQQQEPQDSFPGASFIEPALTIGSGIVAEPAAGITGLVTSLIPGTAEGSGAGVAEGVRQRLTYAPKTQAGTEGLESLAKFAEPVVSAFSDTEKYMGDFAYEMTGSPTIAAAGKSLPTALLEAIGLSSLKGVKGGTRLLDNQGNPTKALRSSLGKHGLIYENLKPQSKALIPAVAEPDAFRFGSEAQSKAKEVLIEQIKSGGRDDALAGFKVSGNRLAADKVAQEAIRQGFEPGFVQAIKTASPETRNGMKRMLNIMRRIKGNSRYGMEARMTDITGDSFVKRLKFIRDKANQSRIELDRIARNQLNGAELNPQPIVDQLKTSLDDLDITLEYGSNGVPKPLFKESMISKDRTSQRVINDVIDLLAEGKPGQQPDALRFHKLKRQLDILIDFRKKSAGGLTDAGRNVLKDIRHALNESIREVNPNYARVNDVLSESLGAFDDMQKAVGSRIDMFSSSSNKSLGQDIRRIMSNNKTRVELEDAISRIDDVALNLGGKFDDDIKDLAMFARKLEDRFGSVAPTSFKGEIESGVKQAFQQGAKATIVQKAAEKAGKATEGLRGINDFNAFEAMLELLTRP